MQEPTPADHDRPRENEAAAERREQEEQLDEEIEDSFPANDPPSSTPVQGTGTPPATPREEDREKA